jgi:hypothetical protein
MLASGECATRADLACRLGVSRARVTQVLGLLALAPEVLHGLAAFGDPLPKPIVTERRLRLVLRLPANEQALAVREIAGNALIDSHSSIRPTDDADNEH